MFKGIKKKVARVLALVMVTALSMNMFTTDADAAMTRQSEIHSGELSDGISRLNKKTSVKQKLDNGLYCTDIGTAETEAAIKNAVISYATNMAGNASSVSDAYSPGNFTVSIFESEFIAPVNGTLSNPEGTDGSYKYSLLYRWKQNKDYLNYSTALGARANGITRPYIFAMYIPGVTKANNTATAAVNTIIIPAKSYCDIHGHECVESWIDDSTTATCTIPGKIKVMGRCGACGDEYIMEESDTELFAHEYELINHVDPTCEDDGYDVYACNECGESYTCTIPTYGHVIGSDYEEETIEVAAPMAFSAARMMARSAAPSITQTICSFTCPNCNEKVVENADTFHAHVIENVRVTENPTCKKTGKKAGTCSVCGEEFVETIPMLAHSVDLRSNAGSGDCSNKTTSVNAGAKKCTVCNSNVKSKDLITANEQIYNMAAHKGASAKYILSGTECTGIVYYDACSNCIDRLNGMSAENVKKAYSASNVAAKIEAATKSHDYVLSNTIKEASCSDCGVFEFTCDNCGDVLVRHSEPVAHNFSVEVSDTATCEADGVKTIKCADCDATETEFSPALGHDFGEFVVTAEPACDAEGTKEAHCSRCDAVKTEKIPASAHKSGAPVTENDKEGTDCRHFGTYEEAIYCTECGEEISRVQKNNTVKGPHTPGAAADENIVAPGCTTDGSHDEVVRCSLCNSILSSLAKTDAATGHTPGEAVRENETASTCNASGTYDDVTVCTVCGEELSRETKTLPLSAHTYGEYVSNNDATCSADGTETATCTACGDTVTRAIPNSKTAHKYTKATNIRWTGEKTAEAYVKCDNCGQTAWVHANVSSRTVEAGTCTTAELIEYTASKYNMSVKKQVRGNLKPNRHTGETEFTETRIADVCGGHNTDVYTYNCCGAIVTTEGDITEHVGTPVNGGTADCHTKCDACGEVLSTEHSFTNKGSVEATPDTPAGYLFACDCGYSYIEDHVHEYNNVTSFRWNGNTSAEAYAECQCGEGEWIPAAVTSAVTTEATCASNKVTTYTATALGVSESKNVVGEKNPSNHTGSKRVTGSYTPSTCGAYGSVTYTYDCCGAQTGESVWYDHIDPWCYGGTADKHYKCGKCGVKTSDDHQYVNKGYVAATCTEPAGDLMVCYCGHSYVNHYDEKTIPHTVCSWTAVSGKCEKVGYCTDCGESVTEVEHHEEPSSFVTYKARDCTEQNSVTYNCYCHAEHYYETYGCGPHNFDRSSYSGSKCTGMTIWEECGLCGAQQNVRTVEGTGHSWPTNYETQSAYFAGFTSNGDGTHKTMKNCMNGCGATSTSTHSCAFEVSSVTKKDTCEETIIYTTRSCSHCGYSYEDIERRTGHSNHHFILKSSVAGANCLTRGSSTYICAACGTEKTELEGPGPHIYSYTHISGSCDKVGTCTLCGASTGTVPGAHKKNSATKSVVYASDCRSYNQVYYTCYCGAQSYQESGSKTGPHSYNSKGKCVYCGASKTSSASVMALGMLYNDDVFDSYSDAYEDELINALDNGLITEEEYLAALGLIICDGCVHEHGPELKEKVFGEDHKLELKEFEFGKLELPTEDEVIESEDNEFDEVIESEETEVIDENQDEAAQADESEELVEEAEVTEEEVIEEAEKLSLLR